MPNSIGGIGLLDFRGFDPRSYSDEYPACSWGLISCRIMPRIGAAHIGPVPIVAFKRAFLSSPKGMEPLELGI